MFGSSKKEKEDLQEIAKSASDLYSFTKAVLVFVEEDPNRVKSFLKVMCDQQAPDKQMIQETRDNIAQCVSWINQCIKEIDAKLGGKGE